MVSPILGRTPAQVAHGGSLDATLAWHAANEAGAIAWDLGDNMPVSEGGHGCGTPILAVESGTVRILTGTQGWSNEGWWGRYGIMLYTDSGHTFFYAHNRDATVTSGQKVNEGEIIGHVGAEGNADGCHLHFMASDKPHDDATMTTNKGTNYLLQIAGDMKAVQTASTPNGGSTTLPPLGSGAGSGSNPTNEPKPITKNPARAKPAQHILSFLVDHAVVGLNNATSGGLTTGALTGGAKETADALHSKLPADLNKPQVIAGIMGNVQMESNFDPHIHQVGGPAQGLFQWQDQRLTDLFTHFGVNNIESLNVEQQVEYAVLELTRDIIPQYGAMPTDTAENVAKYWDEFWERSSGEARQQRIDAATRFFQQLSTKSPTPATQGASATFHGIENEIIGNSVSFHLKESWGALGTPTEISLYNIYGELLKKETLNLVGTNTVKALSQDIDLSGEIEIGGLSNGSFAESTWVNKYLQADKNWMDSKYDSSKLPPLQDLIAKASYWQGEPLVGGEMDGSRIKINDNGFKSVHDFAPQIPFTIDLRVYFSTI